MVKYLKACLIFHISYILFVYFHNGTFVGVLSVLLFHTGGYIVGVG